MGSPTPILWDLMRRGQKLKEIHELNGWVFRPGVSLYYNPEMPCPRCGNVINTNRIWLVDRKAWTIKHVWTLEGKPISNVNDIWHPHANASGVLCRGNLSDVTALLFSGIDTTRQHYRDVNTWLYNMGHHCPSFGRVRCPVCFTNQLSFMVVAYGNFKLCSIHCVEIADAKYCTACFAEREPDPEEDRSRYCIKCFDNYSYQCSICKKKGLPHNLKVAGGRWFCVPCTETNTFKCADCSNEVPIKDLDDVGFCRDCKRVTCWGCGRRVPTRDMEGNGTDIARRCSRCCPTLFPCIVCGEVKLYSQNSPCSECVCIECGGAVESPGDEFCSKHQPYKCSCRICHCHNPVKERDQMCHQCVFTDCPGLLIEEVDLTNVQVPAPEGDRGWRSRLLADSRASPRLRRENYCRGLRR